MPFIDGEAPDHVPRPDAGGDLVSRHFAQVGHHVSDLVQPPEMTTGVNDSQRARYQIPGMLGRGDQGQGGCGTLVAIGPIVAEPVVTTARLRIPQRVWASLLPRSQLPARRSPCGHRIDSATRAARPQASAIAAADLARL